MNTVENWRLEFPEIDDASVAFGSYPQDWFNKVLEDGNKDEDITSWDGKWGKLASDLFFNGGAIPVNKSLPKEYVTRGVRMLKSVIGSFTPKHEHKEVVCAMILKSICQD